MIANPHQPSVLNRFVTLRLPKTTLERAEDAARQQGLSRSAFIRSAVERAAGAS